jgi:hypothetical protein
MYLTIHLLLCVTCTISHNIGFIFIDPFLTLVHWKSKTKLHQRVNGPCFIFYLWLYNLNEWIHPSLSLQRFIIAWLPSLILMGYMVYNITFKNILVLSWQSVLLVEETEEIYRPAASHWQALSQCCIEYT